MAIRNENTAYVRDAAIDGRPFDLPRVSGNKRDVATLDREISEALGRALTIGGSAEALSAKVGDKGRFRAANGIPLANALIESMSSDWQPEKYRDEYRDAVMEMIETKAKNKQLPVAPSAAPRTTNVVDLVKVLQESINRSQSVRVKRSGNGATGRRKSTPALVKQKRRAAA